jgi:F-type H+-transporting ATPase subunit b
MPQLNFEHYPTQLFWLAVTFVVLYVVMARWGLPRIGAVLAERRDHIAGDLDKAEQMKAEAQAVIAAYERALAEARAEAQQTLKETTERLGAEAAERLRETAQKLAAETAAAERRIAAAKAEALANVRAVAVDVARAAAARLTGLEIGAERTAAAVDAVLSGRPS